ncbi:MAG: hypothetical protein ACE5GK_09315 [Nitrospiria bacterium]
MSWSANNESDLAGYYLYYKDDSDSKPLTKVYKTLKIDMGNRTSYTHTRLAPGNHYFALSAYDRASNESALSVVVLKTVFPAPSQPESPKAVPPQEASGGCGLVDTHHGNPSGPEDSAGMLVLIGIVLAMLSNRAWKMVSTGLKN